MSNGFSGVEEDCSTGGGVGNYNNYSSCYYSDVITHLDF